MTSTRAPIPPVDLKARIAAFQEQQKANAAKQNASSTSTALPKPSTSAGNTNLRDRIASFEKQGAVPAPKGRFGFAPIPQQDEAAPPKRHGELYGNRIPGLSRPHIPVPSSTKDNKRSSSKPRDATRLELERYATSPSPPGSPFLHAEAGDSAEDVLSEDQTSADTPSGAGQEQAQLDATTPLLSPPIVDDPVREALLEEEGRPAEADAPGTTAETDANAAANDEQPPPPSVVISPSEPAVTETPPPARGLELTTGSEELGSISYSADTPADKNVSEEVSVTSEQPSVAVHPSEDDPAAMDAAVQAMIEQLDRATQSGEAGAVVVPAETLETLAALGSDQQKSVQDMLDQLLLQQDALDIATPVKQRFSLNGQLSSQAVLDYLAQQSTLTNADPVTPPRPVGAPKNDAPASQSAQFLSPNSTYSADSPVGSDEPLSPASDIYSAYYAVTPATTHEKFHRALPSIPEAPDSPVVLKGVRRGTFGAEADDLSVGSSAPTSAPLQTPSEDGAFAPQQAAKNDTHESVTPGDVMVRIAGTPPRVMSPPLSVVIPQPVIAKPVQPPVKVEEPSAPKVPENIVRDVPPRPPSPPAVRSTLAPGPHSASGSSSSSPASVYSPNSTYSGDGTSPSSNGRVSRKPSARYSSRSRQLSPAPPSAPYEEPELTPIEGPKSFRAVVHGKVVEGKSRPVSVNIQQYPDLPSPSPLNATGMSDLAALLADAVVFEKQLADVRSPAKKSRAGPYSTTSAPPAASRSGSERPKPTQELPESPEDQDAFARMSQDRSTASRTSRPSGRPLPEHPRPSSRPPSRPSADRTIERKPSRPSLDRVPSRPSLDQSTMPRPSTDSNASSRPQLQPMFLTADPNAVRVPLPPRPKSAMARTSPSSREQSGTPPPPLPPKSPPRTGYLTNLLSRAKSSSSLRPSGADSRDSVGSSSEDSAMVSTPPTPPYDMASETGSIRSSRMFKNSFSRASNFADRLLHRKEGSNQGLDVAIASGDDDDSQGGSQRALPRPPRPLPLPPPGMPPSGSLPPVPGNSAPNSNSLAPVPPGQPQLSRRSSWKSLASVSTTGISEALDTAGLYDSFPNVPETAPALPVPAPPRTSGGLPSRPAAYTSPRPAPLPPLPPPNQPLPPPPSHPLPAPPRGASHSAMGGRPGLPANPASRTKTLPSRPRVGTPPQQLRSGMI
ncbi:hypothetical protein C8Q79DRAFT_629687 [Trametes meyenii]|nr:hypothetical protein C8Q79DRAFT_629687 [Trametes meyenii]